MSSNDRLTAYLAPDGFAPQLRAELTDIVAIYGRLVVSSKLQRSVWAENIWYDAEYLSAASIGAAAKALRERQRNWWPYSFHLHRRHALVQAKLPHVSAKPLSFPSLAAKAPLGSYTLLDEHTMLAAAHCASFFPNGAPQFAEPAQSPPSRAYLKLWEVFTRLGVAARPGERCLDLGASPGGWTWVLASLGASVQAYDRAELAPEVRAMPQVDAVKGDAFSAKPDKVGDIDWLCSDVICYPEKLLSFIQEWLASGRCRNFVCTIKFQGDGHYGVIDALLRINGSQLFHLHHNKHELTWVLLR